MAVFLAREGVYDRYGVEVLGCDPDAISTAEDRKSFKEAMLEIGLRVPDSGIATSVEEGMEIIRRIGLPVIIRPAFTLGGTGGSTAYNMDEAPDLLAGGLNTSPVHQVLVEQSVLGWKEIEYEVMRDCDDNVIMVTSMENVDPMGVHTGDSAVVAPAQTLTAEEYARYVDYCKRIIRRVGVKGGGVNIQYAGDPLSDDVVVIEVNPRLSRSSALASKATGYPIARVATKLAVGYTLDEVLNNVTGNTFTLQEPTVDYVVYKTARFTFEKFPQARRVINTSMKAVGESMSIGRNFKEAFQKGLRSLEIGRFGFGADGRDPETLPEEDQVVRKLSVPNDERFFYIRYAFQLGFDVERVHELTHVDRWFLHNFRQLVELEEQLRAAGSLDEIGPDMLEQAKTWGYSDRQVAHLLGSDEWSVRARRRELGIEPVYKLVDTCAGEVDSDRPYFYSAYEQIEECRASGRKKVMILGGGPNRIGQGIEFDYCCVHAALALREMGYDTVMVNSNPETVSTDYDIANRLYFEPLTLEDILNIVDVEQPEGVVVQLGGQTPLNLSVPLEEAGVRILGTPPSAIDRAEDRKQCRRMLQKVGLKQPPSDTATSYEEARRIAEELGYPVLVRPSYVLGGRAMVIAWGPDEMQRIVAEAIEAAPGRPILIDKFLDDAIEVDVDAVADGQTVVVGGVMEHIEEAGVHSGDSAMVLPPHSLPDRTVAGIKEHTRSLALELGVVGLMNVQYAVKDETIYVLEVNPRASRTIPFVSKATGVPLASIASKVMAGKTLEELGLTEDPVPRHYSVKESVLAFNRFPGVDPVLGPEMKSTGEVMGIGRTFALAFAKSQIEAGQPLPLGGRVFISVKDADKPRILPVASTLARHGFGIFATSGTAAALREAGVEAQLVPKLAEGVRPNLLDHMKSGELQLLINTPSGPAPRRDEVSIRATAVRYSIPLITTVAAACAAAAAIEALLKGEFDVHCLQEVHGYGDGLPETARLRVGE